MTQQTSWAIRTIGEICSKPQYGWTTKAAKSGKVHYLRTTDISGKTVDWSTVPFCVVEPDSIAKYTIQPDDILVSRAGSVGVSYRVCSSPENTVFASYLIRFRAKENEVLSSYLSWFLQSDDYWRAISEQSAGIAVPNVNASKLADIKVPLAPINEQRRIVAKLDQITARIDDAQTRLDTIPAILKRFRQSVLAAACSGRLTAGWRTQQSICDTWSEKPLGQIGAVTGGITKNGKRADFPMQVPYLRVANVYANRLDLTDISFIGVTANEFERTQLQTNDLLIVEGNGSIDQIGRVAIWDGSVDGCTHQNHLIKFRAGNEILPKYALSWLMSPQGRELLVAQATSSAGLHTLSISKVAGIRVAYPSKQEQTEIVRRVEALFKQADEIEARYKKSRAFVEKLTPAVLAKAFRGELV